MLVYMRRKWTPLYHDILPFMFVQYLKDIVQDIIPRKWVDLSSHELIYLACRGRYMCVFSVFLTALFTPYCLSVLYHVKCALLVIKYITRFHFHFLFDILTCYKVLHRIWQQKKMLYYLQTITKICCQNRSKDSFWGKKKMESVKSTFGKKKSSHLLI